MTTLYDLLAALPNDDADGLRAAFRKAAKANHPDNNPGDPDAARRFRQIVRANAILSDERQRVHYDRLLEMALRQRGLKSRRGGFGHTVRSVAPYAIASFVFTIVLIGLDLPLAQIFRTASGPIQGIAASVPEPAQVAAARSTERLDAPEQAGPRHNPGDAGLSRTIEKATEETTEKPENSKKGMTQSAAVSAANADDAPTGAILPRVRDFGVNDARYYRQRGIEAYRSGDMYLALVDFDLAIHLDPRFSDAYVDRGIVLYRMGELKRALADVAQAKRIDDVSQSHALMLEPQSTSTLPSKD